MPIPTAKMIRIATGTFLSCGSILMIASGCSDSDQASGPAAAPAVASNGAAPTFGESSGMGFPTGNAHSDGSGSGLMGYPLGSAKGTGAKGTSFAITDGHPIGPPTFPTTDPVLPAP